jgi:hypothetical protein
VEAVRPLRGRRAEAVTRLVVDGGPQEVELRKQAGHWTLEAPAKGPADDEACSAAASALAGLELGSVVSRDAKSYASYGVDESSSSVRVRVYLEGSTVPALDGYFGRLALGPNTAYFRGYRERDVRLAVGASRSLFERPPSGWRKAQAK